MKLTARQRYDYRDPTRPELLLTRAGHYLWAQTKRLRAKSGDTDAERLALYAALEIVWETKRAVKTEIEASRAARFKSWQRPSEDLAFALPARPEMLSAQVAGS